MRHLLGQFRQSSGPVTCPGGPRYFISTAESREFESSLMEGLKYLRCVPLYSGARLFEALR